VIAAEIGATTGSRRRARRGAKILSSFEKHFGDLTQQQSCGSPHDYWDFLESFPIIPMYCVVLPLSVSDECSGLDRSLAEPCGPLSVSRRFSMFAGSDSDADVEPRASPSLPFEEKPPAVEEQHLPPRKNIAEIAASTLPEHAKISAEVMWLLQQGACEFSSFIMSEAGSNIPSRDQAVRAEHILAAMRNLSARHACPCLSCLNIPKCSRVAACWYASHVDLACFFPALEAVTTHLSEQECDLPPLAQMMQGPHSKHCVLVKKRKSRSESAMHSLQALRTSAAAASSSGSAASSSGRAASSSGSAASLSGSAASSSSSTVTLKVGELDPEHEKSFERNQAEGPALAEDAWTAMITSLSRSESATHSLQALRTSASAASSSGSTATFPASAASSSGSTATVTVGGLDPEQDESFVRNRVDCPELADDAWTAMMTSLLFADSQSERLM
jgi:hypothetical protein